MAADLPESKSFHDFRAEDANDHGVVYSDTEEDYSMFYLCLGAFSKTSWDNNPMSLMLTLAMNCDW